MKVFIFSITFLFLFSCSSNLEIPDESSTLKDSDQDLISATIFQVVGDYNGNLWSREWTQFIYDSLEYNTGLLENDINEQDLQSINCSNFNSLSKTQRTMFWALFMSSVSHFESSFNPNERYYESSMKKYSEGLFQLSTSDSSYYSNCDVDNSNILDPKENIRCAISILDVQIEGSSRREPGRLFPDSYFYWSVLTRSSSKIKVQNFFKERVGELLPFCL
ncbi:hypothetical protein [Halobacteriovorax sp.]|uniref:hypothetical protein n=1 Tax=Halobacteriovorax sp. TaxID=2020862 RepID=UPI00356A6DBD